KEIVISKPRYYTQHLLACLNAPSDLRQELQGETDIGDALENPLKSIAIPSRQTLGGKLLNNAANKLQTITLKTIQNTKAITLTFNEEGEVIIYNARDISSEHSTMEATIKLVKDLLIEDGLKDVNIIAIVTNSSSGYAAVYRKLRKELLTIIWLPCFAHQANLSLALSQAVTSILDDCKFFNDLHILKAILKLFVETIALLEKNNTRLYHVLICFGHFSQIFSYSKTDNQEIQEFKLIMIERLEKY
ncbi:46247_t:CDS:2, partial [Gigaspora margarita]